MVGMPGQVSVDLTPLWQREIDLVGAYAYGAEPSAGRRTFDLAIDLVHDAGLDRSCPPPTRSTASWTPSSTPPTPAGAAR